MRWVVLDTETTGLAVERGHRVVEIGCVELVERRPSGRRFQRYLNPERPMDPGASEVTGLTDAFLADKPRFEEVVDEFLDFVRGAELVIHNAAFDLGFLNAELARLGRDERLEQICTVTDTLALARERYPGQRNSLDALCRRLQIDNRHRTLHGALLDAELLAEVYLAMTAGQAALSLEPVPLAEAGADAGAAALQRCEVELRVLRATDEERRRHEALLAAMREKGVCLWPAPEREAPVVA
ncbi:MAG: DNA polymerase III subunit epsilon [Lysobacteraceae bacterium]|nr:MAG: DNA polymerase III subunit epsilon [Xanthomonadaceae bacterium]